LGFFIKNTFFNFFFFFFFFKIAGSLLAEPHLHQVTIKSVFMKLSDSWEKYAHQCKPTVAYTRRVTHTSGRIHIIQFNHVTFVWCNVKNTKDLVKRCWDVAAAPSHSASLQYESSLDAPGISLRPPDTEIVLPEAEDTERQDGAMPRDFLGTIAQTETKNTDNTTKRERGRLPRAQTLAPIEVFGIRWLFYQNNP
jgi:hypothetical protein